MSSDPSSVPKEPYKVIPPNDIIRSVSQLSKQSVHKNHHHINQCTFCGELVELDILLINTHNSKMPSSYGGFNHVLLAVDSYSSFVTHIPIKSMIKPQRFVSALVIDAGHPIKQLKMGSSLINWPS